MRRRSAAPIPFELGALGLALSVGASCAKEESVSKDGKYLQLLDLDEALWGIVCECFELLGYESEEECIDYFGDPFPPPLAECVAEVLGSTNLDDEALACELDASTDFNSCVEALTCADDYEFYTGFYDCQDERSMDLEDCPEIPYPVEMQIAEVCYGDPLPPPFTCDDGMQIPETWECDGYPDCDDESDEDGCPCIATLPSYYICDGYEHCPDGEDEVDCPECIDEIPPSWICDGYEDCPDGSDEQNCAIPKPDHSEWLPGHEPRMGLRWTSGG